MIAKKHKTAYVCSWEFAQRGVPRLVNKKTQNGHVKVVIIPEKQYLEERQQAADELRLARKKLQDLEDHIQGCLV